MAQKYEAPRGMEDILPAGVESWQWLEKKARHFFETWGFQEIRTPIVESTELFSRSIGEASDIVHKEMYTFEDRGGRSLTLRPEMTASVARAVIQNGLLRTAPSLRLYYVGPMFRAERPQAGRKRQFHQIGAEMVGDVNPQESDFMIIQSLYLFLRQLGLRQITVRMNDLSRINGDQSQKVRAKVQAYFEEHKEKLDKDSLYRLDKNVLRIFDSKIPETQAIAKKLNWEEIAPLSEEFKKLQKKLEASAIPCEVSRGLVRGLDYYTGIVFEVAAEGLGAQDAVAGGGRYDRLYHELGGSDIPCTGFSIGMERLLMSLEHQTKDLSDRIGDEKVYIAPLEDSAQILEFGRLVGYQLRKRGFLAQVYDREFSLSKHLKKANKLKSRYVLILGPEELKKKQYLLKDMKQEKQESLDLKGLLSYLCVSENQGAISL